MSDHLAPETTPELVGRLARIRLLCLDVDGVLTDGQIYLTPAGEEIKAFSTQDGHALKMLASTGVGIAIITGRSGLVVARRARELGVEHLFLGSRHKRATFATLLERSGLAAEQVAHMGDDIPDLPVLRRAGLALAPANLNPTITPWVHHVTRARGGFGAVREVCELIMRAQGSWEAALEPYL